MEALSSYHFFQLNIFVQQCVPNVSSVTKEYLDKAD